MKKVLEGKNKLQHELTQKLGRFINHFKTLEAKMKTIFDVRRGLSVCVLGVLLEQIGFYGKC